MSYPTGKGMFIRNWSVTGSPAQAVAQAKAAGLAWVSPLYAWYSKGNPGPRNVKDGPRYAEAFREAGIELWPWVYPVPGTETETQEAIARMVADGATGVILDPEHEYKKKPTAAAQLMTAARAAAGGLPIGVSSYGYAKYHPTFPYKAFNSADFGVPQVYDLKDNQGSDYQRKGVQSWRDAGFKFVIPALTTASSSYTEVLKEYNQAPIDDGGVVWWDWQVTNKSEWSAIQSIDLKPRSPAGVAIAGFALVAVAGLALFLIKKR